MGNLFKYLKIISVIKLKMSAIIGLFIEVSAWMLVKTIKLVWKGGKWLLITPPPATKCDSSIIELEKYSLALNEKIEKLIRERNEEKKINNGMLRKSI